MHEKNYLIAFIS